MSLQPELELSGFNQEEFEDLIAEFGTIPDTVIEATVVEDDFDVQGALDNINESETKRGDIWQLGPHHLMCGDSTREKDVGCLMDGELANLVVTDPPYNCCYRESDSARLAADAGAAAYRTTTCQQRNLQAFCIPFLKGIRA